MRLMPVSGLVRAWARELGKGGRLMEKIRSVVPTIAMLIAVLVLSFGLLACSGSESSGGGEAESDQPAAGETEGLPVEDIPADEQNPSGEQDPPTSQPEHSALYVDGLSADDVVAYFMEVCLGAEFVHEGDVSALQKWVAPVTFRIHGNCTAADRAVIESFVREVNGVEGFPGMVEAAKGQAASMDIYFCGEAELIERTEAFVAEGECLDGAVRFWAYDDEIYSAVLGCRDDIDQDLRASVIVEEIYNGLGPVQDSVLREDSVIYQYGSDVKEMSDVDLLLLKLLYNPAMSCGMDASLCESVIRQLYY